MIKVLCFSLAICVLAVAPAAAAAKLDLDGHFTQGGLVLGRVAPECRVRLDRRHVRVAADGRFVIGFGWNHAASAMLRISCPGSESLQRRLEIKSRRYKTQRIDGLPPAMVTPPEKMLARIRRENARIAEVRQRDTAVTHFRNGFVWPLKGAVTGVFGSRRILNGEPRRPHFGVDISTPVGTPVSAPADGTVALAENDLYFTGGTVMLNHGHGLSTIYSHLSEVSVAVGQRVRRGDVIGRVGASGRATGAHLDWRMNWFSERLDPALVAGPQK